MEYWCNKWLSNFLNDVSGVPRIPCYYEDECLIAWLGGSDHFKYTPVFGIFEVNIKTLDFDKSKIDKSILKAIYEKLSNLNINKSQDQELKEKYKISKKRKLNEKDLEQIKKYEDAISARGKTHTGKKD